MTAMIQPPILLAMIALLTTCGDVASSC